MFIFGVDCIILFPVTSFSANQYVQSHGQMFRTKCHRAFLSLKGRGMIRDTSRSQEEIKGLFKDFGMTMGYLEDLRYVRLPLTPPFVTA
ncbi:hypothetical protein PNOK_0465600 [Pyrrhoderma noxium]|uniref:Uncharacterized protein n=1 Tax=Pyrrhoderma noxium TaxID=2282107 RepID=A0A286UJG1_9AGAM|nr:hypothetical protein PNOK_0465600 [Pyrrhoderma noxium]